MGGDDGNLAVDAITRAHADYQIDAIAMLHSADHQLVVAVEMSFLVAEILGG